MKKLILGFITVTILLVYLLGRQLHQEAQAVLIGAICGISAAIPVTIGLVIAASNWWDPVSPATHSYDYSDASTKIYQRTNRGDEYRELGVNGRIVEGKYKISGGKSCKTQ